MKKIKLLLASIIMLTLVACGSNEAKIELKKEEFIVEYGSEVSEEAKDYVKADKEVLKETGISFKDVKYENREVDGKEIKYLEVGEYKATAIYKEETLDFKIVVKDTTAPEFIEFQEKIEVEQGTKEVDYSKYFKAEDLTNASIGVDHSKVDLNTVGEYSITVTAVDNYKNESKKEATVVVKEKAKESTESDDANQDSQTTGDTSNGTNSTGGSSGTSTNTGGGSSTGNTGGTTPAPTAEVCPGGYNPSLPCDAIITDTREGQNHKLFDNSADVENIFNLWAYGEFDKAKELCGEDLSPYGQLVGAQIMYNNGSKKYTFKVYY